MRIQTKAARDTKGPIVHTQHFGLFLTELGEALRILSRIITKSDGNSDFIYGSGVT